MSLIDLHIRNTREKCIQREGNQWETNSHISYCVTQKNHNTHVGIYERPFLSHDGNSNFIVKEEPCETSKTAAGLPSPRVY